MALLFKSAVDSATQWQAAFREQAPDIELRVWPEIGAPEDVRYGLLWGRIDPTLAALANLRVLFSLGAGVDHLLPLPPWWRDVPIVRMIDDSLTVGMSEYVLYHVLRVHRDAATYEEQQRQRRWHELPQRAPSSCRVGILGLGVLGCDAARKLALLGFAVAAWSRGPKQLEGVDCYHGDDGLRDLLARTDILVCLLPLTPQTRGILNAALFAKLPSGGHLIAAGRGAHLVEADLLAALHSGQLRGATLDVFAAEPLPAEHPFWPHPRITLTPHIASITNPHTAVWHVIANIRRYERGEAMVGVVDPLRSY